MKLPKMATKEDMEFLEMDYDRISHSMHHDGRGNLMFYMTARMAGISPRGANAMVNTFTGDASESGGNGKKFTPYLLELFITHMHKELMLGEFSTYSNGRGVPDEPEEGNDSHKNNGGENE